MSLAMSLRSRGPAGSAARAAKVLSRFGATSSAMAQRLDRYDAIAAELGVRPTWPTTACVLARNPELLRRCVDRGAELAVHGLVHGDHAMLERAEQRDGIARALEIFAHAGIEATGFRGPYLRYNAATIEVLRELGFRYHSSQAVLFPVVDGPLDASAAAGYQLAVELYSARDARRVAVIPRLADGLVDIPVAIPDDEILIERLGLEEPERTATWLRVLDWTYTRGDLFTLQLHPERIGELGPALHATLAEARRRRPSVFIARLDEIASWWTRRSGFALSVTRRDGDRYQVRLRADDDATLLVRGLDVPRSPWHRDDAISDRFEFEVVSDRMPVVGISRRSPPAVARFLAEEGLPFEISDDRRVYGAYVDVASTTWREAELLETIDASGGPLVWLGRWPAGARSALAATGDIDAITLLDFALRSWETRRKPQKERHP